ncbi:MAG: HD domain-containing phosphohydrolase, partial [Syntrophobacteraceae bacterium]
PMHDVGKIGIPDNILLKPGALDPMEWEIMKSHTTIGAKILSGHDSLLIKMGQVIALTHHEKWNGSGYPQGLSEYLIPLAGRIVSICDVFDALTSERPYKKAWPLEKALELIKEGACVSFDPRIVDAFFSSLPEILKIRERFGDGESDGSEYDDSRAGDTSGGSAREASSDQAESNSFEWASLSLP